MGAVMTDYVDSELTSAIIKAFYDVYNELGYGFLEKVYENALLLELRERGHQVVQQAPLSITYHGVKVGEYHVDLLVNDCVILELKAADSLAPEHEAQLLNYLKASGIKVGLLLNFGPHPQVRRKVFDTARVRQRTVRNTGPF
jgi:GxxExxY protein